MIKPYRSGCISISHIYWLLADKAPKQNEENLKHCLNVANQNEDLKIISFFCPFMSMTVRSAYRICI